MKIMKQHKLISKIMGRKGRKLLMALIEMLIMMCKVIIFHHSYVSYLRTSLLRRELEITGQTGEEAPFLGKSCSKNQNCLFNLKFIIQSHFNMLNMMVSISFSILDRLYPFWIENSCWIKKLCTNTR